METHTAHTHAETVKEATPPMGPLSPDAALPTLLMFLIAMMGGAITFWQKWKEARVRAFNFTEFLGECVVSGVCGVFAYWVFSGFQLNPYFTAAGVGIVGHLGSRALMMAEAALQRYVDNLTGPPK